MSFAHVARRRASLTTSESFELESIDTSTGRWAARLWFVTRHGRKKTWVCSAVLREEKRGGITLDLGSRGRGGRKRLGTRDPQEAINRAEPHLAAIGEKLAASGAAERILEYAGGDLTIPQLATIYFQVKNPGLGSIGKHHANSMALMFDIMLELNGPDWTVSMANQTWIDRMIDAQMHGITFRRVNRKNLKPRGWNTARDAVGYFMGAVSVAHRTPDPKRPGKNYQDIDPFSREDVKLPRNRPPKRKQTVGVALYVRLMSPVTIDGVELPAPVDRADPTGATRLMQAAFFHFGVRRAQLRVAKRGHLALSRAEIRDMLERYAPNLRAEHADRYEHGLWLFEGSDNKMGHIDAEGYTRVLPIPSDLRDEIDLYFERRPDVRDAMPRAPLFASPADPRKPISDNMAFGSPIWCYSLDENGDPIIGLDGLPEIAKDEYGRQLCRDAGGHFHKAYEIARRDMQQEGLDWAELCPYARGSLTHSWRAHREAVLETLGYLKRVVVDNEEVNLRYHVDYVMMRKLPDDVRVQHYLKLDTDIMLGIAEGREAEDVLRDRGLQKADEIAEARARLREARNALRATRRVA